MTSAVANAIAITLDKEARAAYDRAVAREDAAAGETQGQSAHEFQATASRLAAMFPAAVKVH